MLKLLAIGTLIAALAHPVTLDDPPPAVPPPNDHIVIEVVTVNGSGCRPGSASVAVELDNMTFTIGFSEYLAQVGVGAQPTDMRKNCQFSLVVHQPPGFTYALASSNFRGFASLAPGATALYRENYYFQGQTPTAFQNHTLTGPFSDDVLVSDTTDLATAVWAPCGAFRNFNINTEIRVNAGTSDTRHTTSFAALESTQGITFQLAPCR